jgi:hypothetical protein
MAASIRAAGTSAARCAEQASDHRPPRMAGEIFRSGSSSAEAVPDEGDGDIEGTSDRRKFVAWDDARQVAGAEPAAGWPRYRFLRWSDAHRCCHLQPGYSRDCSAGSGDCPAGSGDCPAGRVRTRRQQTRFQSRRQKLSWSAFRRLLSPDYPITPPHDPGFVSPFGTARSVSDAMAVPPEPTDLPTG